ncbi:MAG TPA: TetR/AcrR family transcriptional regulator [Deltaproteobacteria bacterium]|nr:TetR/AcrR family transcriptional regulator [Candidatus Binatota bacterium]HIL12879.1 TetR/AcrR family transcriptional regulator [Deltaproteobacteria bacterium]
MSPTSNGLAKEGRSRSELLATAADCFSRYGYAGSSIDRIARSAGVTKGAIYYHFRDKQDLLAATVLDRIAEFEQRVQTSCDGLAADEALRSIAHVCQDHAMSKDHPRFLITLMIESIDTNEQVSDQLRSTMRGFRRFLAGLIRRGQRQELFRADVDPERVASAYTSAVLGAEIQYYQDPDSFCIHDALGHYIDTLLVSLSGARADSLQENGESR